MTELQTPPAQQPQSAAAPSPFPPIADYAFISNCHTGALVAPDGSIDWLCVPSFDSPSLFGSLLDREAGFFRLAPFGINHPSARAYEPGTNVLVTTWKTPSGWILVRDALTIGPRDHDDEITPHTRPPADDDADHMLVRTIECIDGNVEIELVCEPVFDYGRAPAEWALVDDSRHMAEGRGADQIVRLVSDLALGIEAGRVRARHVLAAGESAYCALTWAERFAAPRDVAEAGAKIEATTRYWRRWLGQARIPDHAWRDPLQRSALAIKGLTYMPTGATVAALTTSLPETPGGERNWDYRYTWIRDASFSVYALLGLGYLEEAAAFGIWVRDRVLEERAGHGRPLKIMYRVDGTSDLVEETLDHFEGWRGSRPVRIGNGAADQLQLDIYGEAMDAFYHADSQGLQAGQIGWGAITDMIEWVCEHWDQPDEGIWETRGGQQDFTYGRFQCWVALDRAIRLATERGRPADIARWRDERNRIYAQIYERGWNPKRSAFVQHYGTDVLDSSLLLMPLMGFVAPQDPQWLDTLDAMNKELVSDSLVYRYNPSASPDGLQGSEGTFSLCTFWYVDALARAGRLEEAELVFMKMQTYANHLGLFSEEIGLTGEQLGNFPQAFSHLSLINAAINLDYQLDHGAGDVGAVLSRARRR